MAPVPSNIDLNKLDKSLHHGVYLAHPEPGDEIMITGLSGAFPNSDNVYDFQEKIFNKVDLISGDNRRWDLKHPEIPTRSGKINNITKFDAAFFGIHYKQAQCMDPMCRMMLEKAFEAIVDAGLNPLELRGTKTGVFVGACFSESEKTWFYEKLQPYGYGMTGCARSMLSNRISYWLGVNGPSYTVDSACSSSHYALEHAYRSIREGHCDRAIVGGSNLCLHPHVSLQFARLGVLNPDGKCKCFDEAANGYTRSEAICVILLQKAKESRRVYARLVHAKANCDGYKEQGITYPSGQMQTVLLSEFYAECGVDPTTLNFVEAHGTGTKVGDPEEVGALEQIFCNGRKKPLLIGSIKSSIGHTEPVSGLCSITKVIIGMESGYIPPNINLNKIRQEMKALVDGRMVVVTEKTKWNGGYVGVNSFGFGGANCHVLLKSNEKNKINRGIPQDDLPRLINLSGRIENSIDYIIKDLEKRPLDREYVRLLHEVFKFDIPAHLYRGYALLSKKGTIAKRSAYYEGVPKPLWYVFTGVGSQWLGMGNSLMKLPIFAASIEKCHHILSKKSISIVDIITTKSPDVLINNFLNTVLGTVCIQLAIVDILKHIDIKPNNIIGVSIGELVSGYADGCLTLEQAVLSAYCIAKAGAELAVSKLAVYDIEINHESVKPILPKEIEIVRHNNIWSCTIAGPVEKVKDFVKNLKARSRQINSSEVILHCSLAKNIVSAVKKQLQQIIPVSQKRSDKWVSITDDKFCSPEFLSGIIGNPILLEETLTRVDKNAVVLEIAPQDHMKQILVEGLYEDVTYVEVMKKDSDNVETFMKALGNLYLSGQNPRVERIYPDVEFPVSRSTPMLSPLIKWDHSMDWFVTRFQSQDKIKSGERSVTVTLTDEEMEYISGHIIDGRNLFPATGYLTLVWETVSMMKGQLYNEMPVVFEDVKFLRATNVPKEGRIYLIVMVQKVSGNFEVIEGGAAVVTGRVYVPEHIEEEIMELPVPVPPKQDYYVDMNERDIYKELKLRGYYYKGLFRGLHSCDNTATVGKIYWKGNYVSFMDTMLQMQILQEDTRGLFVPTGIARLTIDANKHKDIVGKLSEENSTLPIYVYKNIETIVSGGIEIRGLSASAISRRKHLGEPVLETYKFIPNIISETNLSQSIRILTQIAFENVYNYKVRTVELIDESSPENLPLLSLEIQKVLADLPLIQADINVLTSKQMEEIPGITFSDKKLVTETNCLIVVASNVLKRNQILQSTGNAVVKGGFILARESLNLVPSDFGDLKGLEIVLHHVLEEEQIIMLKRVTDKPSTFVDVSSDPEQWLANLQAAVKSDPNTVVYAQGDIHNGIIGLVNCIRKEPGTDGVKCVFIMDEDAPKFDPKLEFYSKQLNKGLAINVLKDGVWGTYRHLLLESQKKIEIEHAFVNVTVRGDLSSMRWLEGDLNSSRLECNTTLVHIYYSAMNFRDVMTATGRVAPQVIAQGRIEQECVQGLEYCGRMNSGRRVMGMVNRCAMATLVAADPLLMWDVPDNWTMEEAVTVPVVYGTVYYALVIEGDIQPGQSILIHAGSGGVGQAAINIALYYGCTVYTTVGTQEKRDFIKSTWPQITDKQIGNSRDTSFEQMIMVETRGRGVDFVLNSLSEEKLQASVRCLAHGGKFMEIGKFDLANDNPLPMYIFKKEISFHGIMLDNLFKSPNNIKKMLFTSVDKGIKCGAVKPLSRCVFKEHEIEEAFRYMAAGKHIGKVLIKVRDEEPDKNSLPSKRVVQALPRHISSPNNSYIICGGLGGFGLELADWLVLRGARNLVLTTRKGITNGYQAMRVRIWKSYGVDVLISTEDITTYNGCKRLLEQANEMGPVEGIFNLAVVLRDSIFENQTVENFQVSFGAKAVATKFLDQISRTLCPKLKQFVVFSSVSCGRGNAGQSNYGMSNSVMERICEQRKAAGFPALAVEWGAVGEVGLVAEMQENHGELEIGGTLQQRISSCLSVLDQFLKQSETIVASMVVAEKKSGSGTAGNIVEAVVNILGIRDVKTVSFHSSLAELGMDSIMAVEIKQTLEREFEVFLTPQDIRSMTFARLEEIAAERENDQNKPERPPSPTKEMSEMGRHFIVRSIGDEESASEVVKILTSRTNSSSAERIIMIPGIEGMATVFENLAKNLNGLAVCLQLGFNNLVEDIPTVAASFLDRVLSYIQDSPSFTLVGYSYGTTITLELASLLEARGKTGNIVLIDGAPTMLHEMVNQQITAETEDQFQNNVLSVIISLYMPGEVTTNIKMAFENCTTWNDKLDSIIANAPKNTIHTEKHQRAVCETIYKRLKAMANYVPTVKKLKSHIKLVKPLKHTIFYDREDFGLAEFTEKPVEIVYAEGDHVTILDEINCAEEINRLIPETVTGFKESVLSAPMAMKKEEQVKY